MSAGVARKTNIINVNCPNYVTRPHAFQKGVLLYMASQLVIQLIKVQTGFQDSKEASL